MRKIHKIFATISLLFLGATNVQAGLIDFSTYGFVHDQTLTGNEFLSEGLQVTSPHRIHTACGDINTCITAEGNEGWAYGDSTFIFASAIQVLSIDSVNGNLYYEIFDVTDSLFASGFGDYSYSGTTELAYFTVDYNYDGIYSINSDVEAPIPEPASLALMGLGLVGIGFARKKKAA